MNVDCYHLQMGLNLINFKAMVTHFMIRMKWMLLWCLVSEAKGMYGSTRGYILFLFAIYKIRFINALGLDCLWGLLLCNVGWFSNIVYLIIAFDYHKIFCQISNEIHCDKHLCMLWKQFYGCKCHIVWFYIYIGDVVI